MGSLSAKERVCELWKDDDNDKDGASDHAAHDSKPAAERPLSGRRKSKGDRVVDSRPDGDKDDGVAKVGNVAHKASSPDKGDASDADAAHKDRVDAELESILKKGPIIVFSKSYCPYSKKAKVSRPFPGAAREMSSISNL